MKLKIPNILTIGRIIIVPIFVLTFFIPGFFGDFIPFFLFVIASFTAYLDGLLARLFKEESKLGELLDPIADKILVAAALILLVMNGTIKNYEVIAAINDFNCNSFDGRKWEQGNKFSRLQCANYWNHSSMAFSFFNSLHGI